MYLKNNKPLKKKLKRKLGFPKPECWEPELERKHRETRDREFVKLVNDWQ